MDRVGEGAEDLSAPALLSTEERAAVVAAVLGAGSRATAILARLPRGARLVTSAGALFALERTERVRRLLAEVRELVSERPANLARIHESWIEASLAGESLAVRQVIAGRATARKMTSGVRAWLSRRLLGHLVAMPGGVPPKDRAPGLGELPTYDAGTLVMAIETLGRGQLALAIQAAPSGAAHALASGMGALHGPALLREARTPAAKEAISAAVRRVSDLAKSGGPNLLFSAGARLLGPLLAATGGDFARQLAQRLPRELGRILLCEAEEAMPQDAPEVLGALVQAVREAEPESA